VTSSVTWPIDPPSCHCPIVTEPLSLTVFEIFGPQNPCALNNTHTHTHRKWFYILSHAMYCIGQTINSFYVCVRSERFAVSYSQPVFLRETERCLSGRVLLQQVIKTVVGNVPVSVRHRAAANTVLRIYVLHDISGRCTPWKNNVDLQIFKPALHIGQPGTRSVHVHFRADRLINQQGLFNSKLI